MWVAWTRLFLDCDGFVFYVGGWCCVIVVRVLLFLVLRLRIFGVSFLESVVALLLWCV